MFTLHTIWTLRDSPIRFAQRVHEIYVTHSTTVSLKCPFVLRNLHNWLKRPTPTEDPNSMLNSSAWSRQKSGPNGYCVAKVKTEYTLEFYNGVVKCHRHVCGQKMKRSSRKTSVTVNESPLPKFLFRRATQMTLHVFTFIFLTPAST